MPLEAYDVNQSKPIDYKTFLLTKTIFIMLKNTRQITLTLLVCALSLPAYTYTKAESRVFISQAVHDKVTGIVEDSFGPTIGASIMVKGTSIGTITDIDGKFSLDGVNKGDILVISYVGYITQEIVYQGQVLKIKLVEDTKTLDEVVVVGYATVKKANLTGAVSAVDSKVLADRPIVNLGQGLQGAIPNLNITTSGRPGDTSSFNIRGTNALGGSSPLVLVDGVEMDPNLINPQDVKSVSVLKDASSAAIYGARAAYGVVLITTKGGRKDQATQVTFDASVSFNGPTTRPTYMNSMEYIDWMNTAEFNTSGRPMYERFDQELIDHAKAYFNDPKNNDPVYVSSNTGPWFSNNGTKYTYCGNTDWMKEMYKKSYPVQKYGVNISGGSKKATYYTSLGYMDQGSLIRFGNENFRKFNLMNNISYDVNDWLHFSMKTTFNRTELTGLNQDTAHGNHFLGGDTRPLMPVKHPDGNWSGQGDFTNFPAILENGSRTTDKNDFWNTITMKLTPIEGMSINMDYTFNYYSGHNKNHMKEFNEYGVNGQLLQVFAYTKPNYVYESQNNDTYNAFNFFGDYEKTLGKHYFKVMLGFNQETKHTTSFYAQRENLISNEIPSMGAATGEKYVGNGDNAWATRSGFFRVNYIFADRYLVEVNGRYDLSSKFPKHDRSAFNPSFSLGWKLSEESWWKDMTNSFFDELKVRGSYGSLGNQALDNGWQAYLSNYGTGQIGWIMGTNQPQAVSPGGLVSQSITWETVTQWNVGLDFALLNNRLKGSFDYYQRRTSDILTKGKTLPGVLGANEPQENAAETLTKGWEFEASWNDQLSNGIHYTIGINLSDYQNEVTKFDNENKSLSNTYVGQKQGEIWGYVTDLFQSQAEIDDPQRPNQDKVSGAIKLIPGDIRFKDLDENGVIDDGENTVDKPGDRKIIGNSTPRYQYGFNLGADWKGVDLSLFFQGVGKRDLYLPGDLFRGGYTSQWNVPSGYNTDYWSEDNKGALFPVPRFNGGAINQPQTRYLVNASYCRLKSVTIGYTLPKTWTAKLSIEKLRIYATGENLFTIKSTPEGFDPELNNIYDYPLQRSYSVGLSLTF